VLAPELGALLSTPLPTGKASPCSWILPRLTVVWPSYHSRSALANSPLAYRFVCEIWATRGAYERAGSHLTGSSQSADTCGDRAEVVLLYLCNSALHLLARS